MLSKKLKHDGILVRNFQEIDIKKKFLNVYKKKFIESLCKVFKTYQDILLSSASFHNYYILNIIDLPKIVCLCTENILVQI